MMKYPNLLLWILAISCGEQHVSAPDPLDPIPNAHQLNWQRKERIAFVHFSVNTFTGKEWGFGDEDPEIFNPTAYEPDQWVKTLKAAGFEGAILTVKHHDGFCLWPSEYTEYSVKNSSWKDGKGDVVRDFRDACVRHGLEFGIYLSPWDRNRADYGEPSYLDYFQNQLKGLLTHYGPFFEVWFDGANGGSGYYGGANETRKIDDQVYYDWPTTYKIIKNENPETIIFGDARVGPDVRWCGNEDGFISDTNWNLLSPDTLKVTGQEFRPRAKLLNIGSEYGSHWMPAEVDVSIRPGWFYHAEEDSLVKTPDELVEIYLNSVGRGATLLLNVAPDRRGLIPEADVKSLSGWAAKLDKIFADNLATNAKVSVDRHRGKSVLFDASKLTDGDSETYWATDDGVTTGMITCVFDTPQELQYVVLQEFIALGQRVQSFDIEVIKDGEWEHVATGSTIGHKRIVQLKPVETEGIRIHIKQAKACLTLSNIELY